MNGRNGGGGRRPPLKWEQRPRGKPHGDWEPEESVKNHADQQTEQGEMGAGSKAEEGGLLGRGDMPRVRLSSEGDVPSSLRFCQSSFFLSFFLKIFYLFIFRERGREGEREREKHQCVAVSFAPSSGDLACNPGMYPDGESNWRPSGLQASTQSTEPHQPGHQTVFIVTRQQVMEILRASFSHG